MAPDPSSWLLKHPQKEVSGPKRQLCFYVPCFQFFLGDLGDVFFRKLREGEMFTAVLDLIEAISSQEEESSDEEEMSGVESQFKEEQPQTVVKEHGL